MHKKIMVARFQIFLFGFLICLWIFIACMSFSPQNSEHKIFFLTPFFFQRVPSPISRFLLSILRLLMFLHVNLCFVSAPLDITCISV